METSCPILSKGKLFNFTFRYVPVEHVRPFCKLSVNLQEDVRGYVNELVKNSSYWKEASVLTSALN